MPFTVLTASVSNPTKFYDGGDEEKYPLELNFKDQQLTLGINTLAPECWNWRHYYTDPELDELWQMLGLKFRFKMSRECLVDPVLGKSVFFHPFHYEGHELSVCYVYDEVSNGHFVAWLVAVVYRPLSLGEFMARVEHIKKYWHKDG